MVCNSLRSRFTGVIDFRNSNLENRVLIQIVPYTQIPQGVYSFPFSIQSDNPNDTIAIFKIDLSVKDELPEPEPARRTM